MLLLRSSLLSEDTLQYKQCPQCQQNTDHQTDHHILYKSGNDIGHKRDCCHSQYVRYLGGYMVDMITLCPCRSHDRGIGDGRTMVTHNSTCQTCRHTDDDQMLGSGYDGSGSRIGKYAGYNRDQNTEGSSMGRLSKKCIRKITRI